MIFFQKQLQIFFFSDTMYFGKVHLQKKYTERSCFTVNILKQASAGTMESSDAYVEIESKEDGLEVHIESVVEKQFGDKIEATVRDVLDQCGVKNAYVRVVDRGALECVIRARVETAINRGGGMV